MRGEGFRGGARAVTSSGGARAVTGLPAGDGHGFAAGDGHDT
ncbi:hypothetical protein [Streptomyces luteolus]|uniref:Uncharacterized protein n=1 Tax=Streptomyces luteolus TaxID=3043615 RepID=A0ABT6T382_9ACTN|nr:hypothetical protein [Streptomyces sp. B-S-A12]MDI3422328.1 hypothetical protein [Streptomyces sp. B-S-A12]